MNTWPPALADVKTDAKINVDVDDDALTFSLNAAIAYVQRVRPKFNYSGDITSTLPDPTDDMWLGTVRLAKRWNDRRRSSVGQVFAADGTGADSVAYSDPDIAQMLGIGKYHKAVWV